MSKEHEHFRAMETIGGTCKVCKKTDGTLRHILVKEEYPGGKLDPRWVLVICKPCARQVFNTDVPGHVNRLIHKRYENRARRYMGFSDDYMIQCRDLDVPVKPSTCVSCHWFNGYTGSWITGIMCAFRTEQDGKDAERIKMVFDLVCPDCNGALDDNRIQSGRHKGHGSISCPACKKNHVWI